MKANEPSALIDANDPPQTSRQRQRRLPSAPPRDIHPGRGSEVEQVFADTSA
jgi:hypothetical protein